ncbi:MAG: aldehyde dehydrogenase family protein [Alphaproteobacteria bacterium]|nr:aldehyde dehydrogenase family protein [Alphaproteobacteria bacterium]
MRGTRSNFLVLALVCLTVASAYAQTGASQAVTSPKISAWRSPSKVVIRGNVIGLDALKEIAQESDTRLQSDSTLPRDGDPSPLLRATIKTLSELKAGYAEIDGNRIALVGVAEPGAFKKLIETFRRQAKNYETSAELQVGSIERASDLREEIFGPVLHVTSWRAEAFEDLLAEIASSGFGLTFGLHTRLEERVRRVARAAPAGNVYVNRNMVGAVVGSQPFGGFGLSGTGPKAGGPDYLRRFVVETTLTINTASSGGDTTLLSLDE